MDKSKQKRGKKRNKSYYLKSSQQKRQKLNKLEAGMRGFLITCNRDEKQAVRESYNVLNEYADNLYGQEQEETDSKKMDSDDDAEEISDDDMEKAMSKEVKIMKENQTKPKRFQNCFTNAKNCIFISTALENPCELAHKIFTDLAETKQQKTRFAIRMLPIMGTCKAYLEDIKKIAESILSPHFCTPMGDGKTFAILFRVRNNHSIGRDSVLPMLAQLIVDMNPLNQVHLDNPDLAVLVEVICSVCCMSVIKDFYKFRKYNFHEIVKENENRKDKSSKDVEEVKESSECVKEVKKLAECVETKDLVDGSLTDNLDEVKNDDGQTINSSKHVEEVKKSAECDETKDLVDGSLTDNLDEVKNGDGQTIKTLESPQKDVKNNDVAIIKTLSPQKDVTNDDTDIIKTSPQKDIQK